MVYGLLGERNAVQKYFIESKRTVRSLRCIFCKCPTDSSNSVEHILPESFGNSRHILPVGTVCDSCNNYFSRKVEGPLLSHVSFRNLRALYQIPNKRGKLPKLHGYVAGTDIEVGFRLSRQGEPEITFEREGDIKKVEARYSLSSSGEVPEALIFPLGVDPPQHLMSRFLGKMALEVVAQRFRSDKRLIHQLVEEVHYDRIRNWARYAQGAKEWPYSQRRIFPEETLMIHPKTGEWVQAGFSFDLLLTNLPETYFAFCLYGMEYVINVGGPSIKGYEDWLVTRKNNSPLVERIGLRLRESMQDGQNVMRLEPVPDFQYAPDLEMHELSLR